MRANEVEQFWAKVQKTDDCWIWKDDTKRDGYGRFCFKGKKHMAHRLAYSLAKGEIPDGDEVDHICSNKACVNPDHLRAVSKFLNAQNRAGANKNSTSGVRGVYQARGRWRAVVTLNRKPRQIGYFDRLEDAAAAVSSWRREHMTHSEMDKKEQS